MPASVTRFVWSDEVLKAGLGIYKKGSREVDDFFLQNPEVLVEFEIMDQEILAHIEDCRMRAINGLKAKKVALDLKPPPCYYLNDAVVQDSKKRKVLDLNY